jgi:hypothetical protein
MDRGTWCAVEPEIRDAMAVFVSTIKELTTFHVLLCRHADESHHDQL